MWCSDIVFNYETQRFFFKKVNFKSKSKRNMLDLNREMINSKSICKIIRKEIYRGFPICMWNRGWRTGLVRVQFDRKLLLKSPKVLVVGSSLDKVFSLLLQKFIDYKDEEHIFRVQSNVQATNLLVPRLEEMSLFRHISRRKKV